MNNETLNCIPPSGGILVLDKPYGISSHDAVNRVRRLYGTKQVGHTGTLDPIATGVLCILIGRAVKASEYSLSHPKTYCALTRLGVETDTDDITGNVLLQNDFSNIDFRKMKQASESFLGEGYQIPPMYSAIKRNGKKLYELARSGETVDRAPRRIFIHSITAEKKSEAEYRIWCTVSSGTYIRTLCRNISEIAGTTSCMVSLRRLSACGYDITQAHTLEEIEQMSLEQRISSLLPTETLFLDRKKIILSPFYERLFRSGCSISLKKIGIENEQEDVEYRICGIDSGFFALGKTKQSPEGTVVKSLKLFSL